ncbi:hypothetical protein Tco_0888764 [Tanacetum coccineum]
MMEILPEPTSNKLCVELVAFQTPNSSTYIKKRVPQGKQPGAKSRLRKTPTSSKHHPFSAKDSNPSQPSASTPMVVELDKANLQATGGSASLGVTSEVGSNPQLSGVNSTSIYKELVYSSYTIIQYEFALGHDASAASITKVDSGKSNPHDSVSKQQSIVKGTKKCSFDHIIACTNVSL